MIIWKHCNKLSDQLILNIENIVKKNFHENNNQKIYTTYFNNDLSQQYELLNDTYSVIIEKMMKDIGLFHKTKYHWDFWIQMYNNQTYGHEDHNHFRGDIIISWVHFIRVPNQKCFYFIDSNNNKTYPDHQLTGDIICFPSWAFHGVDKVIEDNFDRLIVSGNIRISYIEELNSGFESNYFDNTVLWTKRYF